MDIFSSIWDWLCNFLSDCLKWIVDLLPDSPFKALDNTPVKDYLPYVNYFIPVDYILDLLSFWLVAVAGYYCWSVVLRWIKAID
ncbi:MAG: hypothetical protein UIM53_00310 [Acutalibacteraceae bacterium]|nr:hypothetical protein [Acutalibacteraceae bacterium]